MTHSPALASLLFEIRQHPAFPELLNAVERPRAPRFKPNGAETAEQFGAKAIYASGAQAQHDAWIQFLSGN